jgi:hypothetical protein
MEVEMWIKIIRIVKYFFVVPVFSFLLLQFQFCTESVNSSDDSFSFKVQVVDSLQIPKPNLKIGVYFHFTNQFIGKGLAKAVNNSYGTTSLRYTISTLCKLTLDVYDLENRIAMQLVKNDRHHAGNYEVHFITSDLFPGVYKCVLIAKDTTGNNTLFRDSTYAVLWHSDPIFNGIGITDGNGIFETRNKLFFPSLYDLPELIRTLEEGPEPVGTFAIEDSVTILVTDTVSNMICVYTRAINNNSNSFKLVFPGAENESNLVMNEHEWKHPSTNNHSGTHTSIAKISSVGIDYFYGTFDYVKVDLYWKTNWELNNQGFEIQRQHSEYNQEYYTIGFVEGHGTTTEPNIYSFIDNHSLVNGDYYYRLKISEIDGSFEYSNSVHISVQPPGDFSLYPNYPNPFN